MAQHHFDDRGRQIGVTKSSEEIQAEGEAALILAAAAGVLILILAPIYPIFLAGYATFNWLHKELGVHELFSGIAGLIVFSTLAWLIVKFRSVRWLYFGAGAVGGVAFATYKIYEASDGIWAGFFGLIFLVFAVLLTRWIVLHEFWNDPWGYIESM